MTPTDLFDDGQVTFGVTAPRDMADVAAMETMGVESFWAGGHIASRNPTPEVITDLAMLAAVTTTAVVGSAVLVLPLYPPVIVAKQLAELDHRSGGRITIGVGAGGEYPAEFAACGIPLADRGARLDDGIAMLRHIWGGSGTPRSGSHYGVDGLILAPPVLTPGGPPIVVSGRGEGPMRRAALVGDGWLPHLFSAGRYARSRERITELADAAGRDLHGFGWMNYTILAVSRDAREADTVGRHFLGRMVGAEKTDHFAANIAAIGNPEQVAERICAYTDAGVRHVTFLTVPGPDPRETGRLLSEEVMPMVRSHLESTRVARA